MRVSSVSRLKMACAMELQRSNADAVLLRAPDLWRPENREQLAAETRTQLARHKAQHDLSLWIGDGSAAEQRELVAASVAAR